jgi:hypothetical protein
MTVATHNSFSHTASPKAGGRRLPTTRPCRGGRRGDVPSEDSHMSFYVNPDFWTGSEDDSKSNSANLPTSRGALAATGAASQQSPVHWRALNKQVTLDRERDKESLSPTPSSEVMGTPLQPSGRGQQASPSTPRCTSQHSPTSAGFSQDWSGDMAAGTGTGTTPAHRHLFVSTHPASSPVSSALRHCVHAGNSTARSSVRPRLPSICPAHAAELGVFKCQVSAHGHARALPASVNRNCSSGIRLRREPHCKSR